MKNKLYTGIFLTILSLTFLATGAAAKVDFSGTWKLDMTKSEGLPAGTEQTITVKQTDDTISLQTTMKTPQGEQNSTDTFVVNGKETPFTKDLPNSMVQKGKRTAKWTDDGFETVEESTVEAPQGSASLNIKRKWRLSADGKTLLIDLNIDGPQGNQVLKLTFVKG